MRKVLVIDTSILCVWLKIPNMKTCGPKHDIWDHDRVQKKIDQGLKSHEPFIPLDEPRRRKSQ